ncbi:Son of sevenless -like protein 1 [Toxocara canis]|uniref:Son of sevenless-like protein 1 n=1 Tax=Toxocara canis TaxID=6265 RepID=A0A0B2VLE8_TOXCA|nr:Son of sevenless -like protein 1 [Toxocara canis]
MSVPGPSEVSASRALFAQRQQQWRNQNLFVDRIYQVCNNVHPGIGLERAAVEHIQELLMRILFEILESRPQKIEDMERCMRASLPASMCHWVMQFQETNEALHNLTTKKLHDKRSANARSLTSLLHALQPKIKEHLGYKVDEKVVLYILSVIEYVTADILKWTGNYVKNIRKGNHTIGLQNLKIALSADKSLMELTEMLYNEDEASTAGILNEIGEENWKITQELTYEKVSRDFNHEEEQYLRDLNLIIHVFRRRFESAFGVDDKHYLEEIFGNILELHELTVKVQRIVEDAIEMSDTPCMGAGLWELAEAHELDVYITYMDLFKTSVSDVLSKLLIDPKYNKFFEMEDRSYSVTPGGETFRLAVKYVLPTLLQAPVVHFFRYVEYVNMLIHLSKMGGDLEDLKSAKSYFSGLVVKIEALCPTSLKCHLKNEQTARCIPEQSRSRQLKRIQEIQRSIELWEGKEIGYTCAEVIREGDLLMVRPGVLPTSEMIKKGRGATDRHLFLFDHLLVLTKIHRSSKPEKPLYKYKGKVLIRKTDIFDLSDTEELQNAFKIESRSSGRDGAVTSSWILFCKSAEEKTSWMSDLVMIQTKSLLDRMLDSSLKEEEKRIPLIIPGPDQYRFVDVDCDENIVFEDYTSSSGIPVVKHGTVLKLIERLTYPLYTDNNYVRTFLTTYRSFCTPQEMLQLLIERFNVPTPHQLKGVEQTIAPPQTRSLLNGPYATVHSRGLCGQVPPAIWSRVEQSYQRFRKEYQRPIQCRVLSVIRQWVNGHWYDFEGDDKLLENLCAFLEETDRQANVTNQHKKWCKSIQMCIERKRRSDSTAAQTPTVELEDGIPPPLNSPNSFAPAKPPKSICNPYRVRFEIVWHTAKKGDIDSYDLLTLHPLEIGRQVTLLQFDLYRAIKPIELVGSAWTKRDKDQRSPQLLKLIDHSTMLTYWVARSIVETPSLEERVGMFSRVLEVMAVFEELNNFTGLVALYSALNSSSVYRLKACWERIDREKQMCYEKFKKLCNPHWKEMIQRLQRHYLSKIFFYEEGNSTFVQNSDEDLSHEQVNGEGATNTNILNRKVLVSFVKCRRIAAIISDIQMYQNQPYSLQVEPSIRRSLDRQ